MAIQVNVNDGNDDIKIKILGRFDFSEHKAFRDAYSKIDPTQASITIDLSKTIYMDSAALGMLLVLRERAGGNHSDITIVGFNESVGQILQISRFENLFKVLNTQVA